jgi:hypothetical protein
MDELASALVIENHKKSGRSCLSIIIRGTSVGRSIWRTNDGWRRMRLGAMGKEVAPRSWARLSYRAYFVVVVVAGNCKYTTAAMAAKCHATPAEEIEEIVAQVPA